MLFQWRRNDESTAASSEPWVGRTRRVLRLLLNVVLAVSLFSMVAATYSAATLRREWDIPNLEATGQESLMQTSFAATHGLLVRIELVCFYTIAPLVLVAVSFTELLCFHTEELVPAYVVICSVFAILVWAVEVSLWTVCRHTQGGAVPSVCPITFEGGKGVAFQLTGFDGATCAVAGAALLVILHFAIILLGAKGIHKEHNQTIGRKWLGSPRSSPRTSLKLSAEKSSLDSIPEESLLEEGLVNPR